MSLNQSEMQEIKSFLSSMGAVRTSENVYEILPKTSISSPIIESYQERTRILVVDGLKMVTSRVRVRGREKIKKRCLFNLSPKCWTKTAYIDPKVDYKIAPSHLTELSFHVFSGYFEGKVMASLKNSNQSKEGQECTCKAPFARCNPTKDGTCNFIKGSADIKGNHVQSLTALTENKSVSMGSERTNYSSPISPNRQVSAIGHWRSAGGWSWDTLSAIATLATTGKMKIRSNINASMNYTFLGSTRTISKKFDITGIFPVKGNVRVIWD